MMFAVGQMYTWMGLVSGVEKVDGVLGERERDSRWTFHKSLD